MLAVKDEGVEHRQECRVPDCHQILRVELQLGGELPGDLVQAVQEHQEHGAQVLLAALLPRQVRERGGERVAPGELEPEAHPHRLYESLQPGPGPEVLTQEDHGEGGDQEGRGPAFSLHQHDRLALRDSLRHLTGRVQRQAQRRQPARAFQT